MSASAGRVLIKPKGAYNPLTTYAVMDYVTYTDGNGYLCIEPTTGHAPTDTTYWQLFVDNTGTVHTTDIANNLTTQTAGKVLDASQGYALNNSLANKVLVYDLAVSAGTNTTIASKTDSKITEDYRPSYFCRSKPSATFLSSWSIDGSTHTFSIIGTCTDASQNTISVVLVRKDNT